MMGIWNFAQVVLGVIGTFDLGTISAADRELPILRGKRDTGEEIRVRSTVLWFSFLQFALVGVIAIGYAYWNSREYTSWQMVSFYVAAFLSLSSIISSTYTNFFQNAQYYVPLSRILLIMSFMELLAYSAGTYFWGLYGLFATTVGTAMWKSGYLMKIGLAMGLKVRIRIYKEVLWRLLHFGFPLRIIDYPNAYFKMIDLLWVTRFMDIGALALYSMSRVFFSQLSDITVRVGTVLGTQLMQEFGGGAEWDVMGEKIRRFLLAQLLVGVPFITWAGAMALPFLVRQLTPKYSAANDATIILLIGNFFVVINSGLTNPWFMQKRLLSRGISNIAGLIGMLLSLAVTWYILERRTMTDIAFATTAGYFIYFTYMLLAVGNELWGFREAIVTFLYVILAASWTGYVLFKGNSMLAGGLNFWPDLMQTLKIGSYTLIAVSPVVILGVRKSNLLKSWKQAR